MFSQSIKFSKLNKIIIGFFLLSCFLPYSPHLISFLDLQPFAPFLAAVIIPLTLYFLKIDVKDTIWIFIGIFISLFNLLLFSGLTNLRINLAFLSFSFFYIIGFNLYRLIDVNSVKKIIKFFFFFWILAIIFQVMGFSLDFMSPNRTNIVRGFTSLAPEATFAALHMIYFLPIFCLFYYKNEISNKEFQIYVAIILFLSIFVHLSATVLLSILIAAFFSFLVFLKKFKIFFLSLISIFVFSILLHILEIIFINEIIVSILQFIASIFGANDVRILNIIEVALQGNILRDASAFDRLTSSMKVLLDPYFLPFPRSHEIWIYDVNSFISNLSGDTEFTAVNSTYRNLSGIGQLNFTLGILLIFPLLGLFKSFFIFKKGKFYLLIFLASLVLSTQIAHPLIGLILGLFANIKAES
jgi:hypothetical protein